MFRSACLLPFFLDILHIKRKVQEIRLMPKFIKYSFIHVPIQQHLLSRASQAYHGNKHEIKLAHLPCRDYYLFSRAQIQWACLHAWCWLYCEVKSPTHLYIDIWLVLGISALAQMAAVGVARPDSNPSIVSSDRSLTRCTYKWGCCDQHWVATGKSAWIRPYNNLLLTTAAMILNVLGLSFMID